MSALSPRPKDNENRTDFIREIVIADRAQGKYGGRVVTRFPPEPNGYLHIGHAKSICLNFGIARDFDGVCHLRFDDSNPAGESIEYVESIQRDVRWLGFEWGDRMFFASDYFERLYEFAVGLIRDGKAYVCSLNEEQIREYRGTISEPGRPSPYRERSVQENLDLFARMRAGEFPDGAHVLRAKIDMSAANMKMRDPLLYRIRHVDHYRTGSQWCIYPLYDFIHCLSDHLEGITHSICTLEFDNNRELYDWIIQETKVEHQPKQYEFARLNLTYTVMSKRRLLQLVQNRHVSGWDDPRMPTIAGLRRRGYTPEGIRAFCERIGVAKNISTVDVTLLEHSIRDDLNERSPRTMAVLRPLRVVIDNFPEERVEELDAPYWPHDIPKTGSRSVPFSRVIYIEREDFSLDPPKGYHRLTLGGEVRLRYAYVIKCHNVVRDDAGEVIELHCTYDPDTKSGDAAGRKVKGTIHWVSAAHAFDAEVRLYDRLFNVELPGADGDFLKDINPDSLVRIEGCKLEPSLATAAAGERYQFERHGFFFVDPIDSRAGKPVFNRTVQLKDTWAKIAKPADKPAESRRSRSGVDQAPASVPVASSKPKTLSEAAQALQSAHGLSDDAARVLADSDPLRQLFLETVAAGIDRSLAARWVVNEVAGAMKGRATQSSSINGRDLSELLQMIQSQTISGSIGKEVLVEMLAGAGSARQIVEKRGLSQIGDASALESAVDRVLAANPDALARYRAGNANLFGAFVGMVMKETQGKANPKLVNDLLRTKLA